VLALVLAMAAWGVSFSMNRWMLEATPLAGEPWQGMSLSALRFAAAGLPLAVWAGLILWRRRGLLRADWGRLVLLGLLAVPGYHLAANSAQSYASASLNAVLQQMTPAVAFLGGLVFLREKLSALKVAGLAVASAGAVWYSVAAGRDALAGDNIPLAVLLVVLVAVDWTLYLVVAKRLLQRWSGMELAVVANAIGAVILLGLAEALRSRIGGVRWSILAELSPAGWAALAFLSLVAGILCYVLYNMGLKIVEASRAAVFGYLLVPAAMLSALALPGNLREALTIEKVAAAAIIIAGVWLVTWRRRAQPEQHRE